MDNDDDRAGKDARRAKSCYSTAYYESSRIWSRTTDDGSNLEDQNCNEENDLWRIVCVDATERKLEGATGEEICTTIPTNIAKGVEIVSNAWDRCCEDSTVLFRELVMFLLALKWNSPKRQGKQR